MVALELTRYRGHLILAEEGVFKAKTRPHARPSSASKDRLVPAGKTPHTARGYDAWRADCLAPGPSLNAVLIEPVREIHREAE